MKNPAKRSRKKRTLSAEDKRDNAAFRRGMRELRKHGGYYMTDARQII